jgi:hypothetical protein
LHASINILFCLFSIFVRLHGKHNIFIVCFLLFLTHLLLFLRLLFPCI